jgi:anti-sigma factor RsiW
MMYSDAQLQDYLAGTLDIETAEALEEQIATDQTLESRLLALEHTQTGALRAVFDAVPDPDRLDHLERQIMATNVASPIPTPAPAPMPWKWASVAAVGAFAVGAYLFSIPPEAPATRWQDQVASYQALYVTDTLAAVSADANQIAVQLAKSEQALGRDLPLDVVGDLDGLQLLRAQILGYKDAPLIQMAYLTEDGIPVALCAIRPKAAVAKDFAFETLSGLPTVHWSDGSFNYMIVGDIDNERLMEMAQGVSTSL